MSGFRLVLFSALGWWLGIGLSGAIPMLGEWEMEEEWEAPESWEMREPPNRDVGVDEAWELLLEAPTSDRYLRWLEEAWERKGGDAPSLREHVESRAKVNSGDAIPWLIHARLQARHDDPVVALIDLAKRMRALQVSGRVHGAYSRVFDEIEEPARKRIAEAMKDDVPAVMDYLERSGILEPEPTFSAVPMSLYEPRTFLWPMLEEILDGPDFRRAELVEAMQAQKPQHFSHVLLRLILTGEERRKQKAVNYLGERVERIDDQMPPEGQRELAAFFRQFLARTRLPARNPEKIEQGLVFVERYFDLRGDGDLRRLREANSFEDLGQDAGSAGAFGYRWLMSTFYERPELAERGFERLLELAEDPDFLAQRERQVRPAQSYAGEVLRLLLDEHGNFISVGLAVRLLRGNREIGNAFESRLQYAVNWSFTEYSKRGDDPLESLDGRLRFLVSEAGDGSYAMLADGFFHFFEELAERDPELADRVRAHYNRESPETTDAALAALRREIREAIRFHDWSVAVARAKHEEDGAEVPAMTGELEEHYLAALTGPGMGKSGRLMVARFLARHGGEDLPSRLMGAVVDLSVDRLENFQAWDRELRGLYPVLVALVRRDRENEEWREWARSIVVPFVRNAGPHLSTNIYSEANQRAAAAVLDMAVELDLRAQILSLVEHHGEVLPVEEVFGHLANAGMLDQARDYLESEWPRLLKSVSYFGLRSEDLSGHRVELLERFTDPGMRFLAEVVLASRPDRADQETLWFMHGHFHDLARLEPGAPERSERSRRMEALAASFSKVNFAEESVRRAALLQLGRDPFAARVLASEIDASVGGLTAFDAFDNHRDHRDYEQGLNLMCLHAWLEGERGDFPTLNRWLDESLALASDYRQRRFFNSVQTLVLLPRIEAVWPRLSEAEIGREFDTWKRLVEAVGETDYSNGYRSLYGFLASAFLSGRETDVEAWWRRLTEEKREFFQERYRIEPVVLSHLRSAVGDADESRRKRVLERMLASPCVKELNAPGFNWAKSFPTAKLLSEAELEEWGPDWVVAHPWDGWNAAYLSFHFEKKEDWTRALSWMEKAVELASSPEHRANLMVRQATQLDRAGRVAEARRVVDAIDREKIGGTNTPGYFRKLLEKHGWE